MAIRKRTHHIVVNFFLTSQLSPKTSGFNIVLGVLYVLIYVYVKKILLASHRERNMKLIEIYRKCAGLPLGKTIFSKLVCFKAPYFSSIKPLFLELKPGYCEILLKKRRSVTNHIGSVHAIAMCNVSELAAGTMLEASIPSHMRWIPKGMSVQYLRLARTDLKAICKADLDGMNVAGEFPMVVDVVDEKKKKVFTATIIMHLSEKRNADVSE